MRTLRRAAEDYLSLRRFTGFELTTPGRHVLHFAAFLDQPRGHARHDRSRRRMGNPACLAAPYYHWLRLSAVRGFASHLHSIDPDHQVPPADLVPRRYYRPDPYLLSDSDIVALITAADTLRPAMHSATYKTVIGLLAVAGLRPSEALTLTVNDVDLAAGVLRVHGKYGKTREILLHATTITALDDYARLRNRTFLHPADASFFVSVLGTRLNDRRFHYVFRRLVARVGLLPVRRAARRLR